MRIKHCTLEELNTDIVKEYSEEVIKQLRAALRKDIKQSTTAKRPWSRRYRGLTIATEKYCHQIVQKKGDVVFVGNED